VRSVSRLLQDHADVLARVSVAGLSSFNEFDVGLAEAPHRFRLVIEPSDLLIATLSTCRVVGIEQHDVPLDRVIVRIDTSHACIVAPRGPLAAEIPAEARLDRHAIVACPTIGRRSHSGSRPGNLGLMDERLVEDFIRDGFVALRSVVPDDLVMQCQADITAQLVAHG
jgi:hypothetical protein